MGCWEGTCMVSQLPIFEGDKVAVIPILRQKDIEHRLKHSIFYSDDLYRPVPTVLYGEYDSYGLIDNITGSTEQFMAIVKEILIKEVPDMEEKIKELDVQETLRFIERSRYTNEIAFVMILESVWKTASNYTNWWTMDTDYSIIEHDAARRFYYLNNRQVESLRHDEIKKKLSRKGIEVEDTDFDSRYFCTLEDVTAIRKIDTFLTDVNRLWMPQHGAGGQVDIEDKVTPHQILARLVLDIENKRVEERLSEEDE